MRRFFQKIAMGLQRFMQGRYGSDKLNNLILGVGIVCSLCSVFVNYYPVRLGLMIVSYIMLFWALFRMLSRKTYKRYQENKKFLNFLQRLRDRDHRYYRCPKCRQQVRVPKGKGKIAIRCPKCSEKFTRKT